MQASTSMRPEQFQQLTGLDQDYVTKDEGSDLLMDLGRQNQDLNKGQISCNDWVCKNIPELAKARDEGGYELEAQIVEVRNLREMNSVYLAQIATIRQEWEEKNHVLLTKSKLVKEHLEAAEAQLRRLTVKAYQETKNKKPAEGLGIRVSKGVKYNEATVKEWALRENPGFLILDKEGFEVYAKVLLKMHREIPGLVLQRTESVTATIAKVI